MRGLSAQWLLMLLIIGVACIAQQGSGQGSAFVAPDHSFSVQFPTEPSFAQSSGPHAHNSLWVANAPGEKVFMAGRTDYEIDLNPEQQLIVDRDKFLRGVNASLNTSIRTQFNSNAPQTLEALRFTGQGSQLSYEGLVIVDGRRVYVFCVGERQPSVAGTEFLNSVRLNRR
jgi:hypothetical protein